MSVSADPEALRGCLTCHESAAVKEWRWNDYHCPSCCEYDGDFARDDKESEFAA